MARRVRDSDAAHGDEGLCRQHTGKNHSRYHPMPPPVAHPEPVPRTGKRRWQVTGGAARRAH
jgi:hypothetical protein